MGAAIGIGLIGLVAWYVAQQYQNQGAPAGGGGGDLIGDVGAYADEFSNSLGVTLGIVTDPISMARPIVQGFETFSAKAYPDPPGSGKYSIGWGHQIRTGDPYDSSSTISRADADALLEQDLAGAFNCVTSNCNVDLSEQQAAALISFAYNVGCGAFASSTLLRLVNSGDFEAAANQFPLWIHAGGLVNSGLVARRQQEQDLFVS